MLSQSDHMEKKHVNEGLEQLSNLTKNDSLLTSSVIGVINLPKQRFKLVNRLKRRQGAFKICRTERVDKATACITFIEASRRHAFIIV